MCMTAILSGRGMKRHSQAAGPFACATFRIRLPAHTLLDFRNTRTTCSADLPENISRSKDWCSYWEITYSNRPAPIDFKSDQEFWYNLPANFDVLDACYRMFLWTGDTIAGLTSKTRVFELLRSHGHRLCLTMGLKS